MKGEPENIKLDQVSGFSLVYDYYSPLIWKHIFLRVSLKEEANDLTSEVFLKTWDYLNSGKKIKKIKSFLYRTADNLIVDWYRSKKRVSSLEQDVSEDENSLVQDPLLEDKIIVSEEVESLMKKIDRLQEKERKILLLRFVDELEIEEISEILGKSKGAITVAIHRALKSLDSLMKND
ncbi:TPA: hypothetical protein DEX28_01955 [Patescibacteria group bacterium]|nr:MAG: RNA polymerase, sigma-24 subunit, ECF subfamily [Parcubacteria group bacterium GW2011_GWA1_Parcubacteria_45_10]KKT89275.1 MAG: RNA polymerase, sigma-24 subunit, ECF subfamily [Parcubacteria group bacterium GW2011_GWB1_45_10]HCI05487.1 hypothetical protein [Patescibacteria group bacterium]